MRLVNACNNMFQCLIFWRFVRNRHNFIKISYRNQQRWLTVMREKQSLILAHRVLQLFDCRLSWEHRAATREVALCVAWPVGQFVGQSARRRWTTQPADANCCFSRCYSCAVFCRRCSSSVTKKNVISALSTILGSVLSLKYLILLCDS